jgi:hypothetical protein
VRLHIKEKKQNLSFSPLCAGEMSELPEQASMGQKQNPVIKAQVLMIRS